MLVRDNLLEDPHNLVMADDGLGGTVNIPSMLINYIDGGRLETAIHEGEEDEDSKDLEEDEDETFVTPDVPTEEPETSNNTGKGKQVIV